MHYMRFTDVSLGAKDAGRSALRKNNNSLDGDFAFKLLECLIGQKKKKTYFFFSRIFCIVKLQYKI